jgi:hypothetical protein
LLLLGKAGENLFLQPEFLEVRQKKVKTAVVVRRYPVPEPMDWQVMSLVKLQLVERGEDGRPLSRF